MRFELSCITPGASHQLLRGVAEALASFAEPLLLRAGFAFVTLAGVERFIEEVGSIHSWSATQKRFVVGLHDGITEPSALERLRKLKAAQVRIFIPGGQLRAVALIGRPLFHPKVIAISALNAPKLLFLQAGSANMTKAAMGAEPSNYEFAISLSRSHEVSIDKQAFEQWWSAIWSASRPLDRAILESYAELRRSLLTHNPVLRFTSEAPAGIASANFFFCEVGAASGPPNQRHQIEFPGSLASFFGKLRRTRRDLRLQRGKTIWDDRPLSYKKTTYGVEIWRLGMPTQTTGGIPIAERAIGFWRKKKPNDFRFDVVDTNSSAFTDWVRQANLDGHLGSTHGARPRQYGFF